MRSLLFAGLLVMVAGATGCESLVYGTSIRDQAATERAEVERLKVDVQRLREQVADLSVVQDRSNSDVAALKIGQENLRREIGQKLDALSQSMKTESAAAAVKREELRTEIVNDVSQKVGQLLRQQTPAPASARSSRGYEHVVKQGETLSQIAAVYGVKVSDITAANNLPSADTIRVGQTLFIPEAGGAR